ncbi:MAG TPA: M20/M25/M40 family metallo-hydrolase [Acidobacteriaceae bacterium]|nr:M20/M25/M40 family metallo-hydrolase [Acidobacteriaceae bacterium]
MMDRWAWVRAGIILGVAFPQVCWAGANPTNTTTNVHGYDYGHVETQPATESLDLGMYARIREEGLSHSHIMEYASALFDDIGPRLTGSPNLAKANAWTRDQLTAMGCSNAHLESWGEFGMGWRQISSSIDMVKPDTAVFIGQATPWSPPTNGLVTAEVIAVPELKEEKDLEAWKGKLAGKIILYGKPPVINPDPAPLLQNYDENKLTQIFRYPLDGNMEEQHVEPQDPKFWEDDFKKVHFKERVAKFFAEQQAAALLVTGWGGGSGGMFRDDNGEQMGEEVYRLDHKQPIPSAVLSSENWGRVSRLLEKKVPVTVSITIHTEFTGDHEQGYNTIAEIPGSDPNLKNQVVMVGGHLDSWIAGTGATDDGAGTIVAMEAMRILTALHVQPRRTIRIGLWTGEEQGDLGSAGYVHSHFGTVGLSTKPEELAVPEYIRERVGPLTVKPEQALISGYFNLDNGGGKLLGIYAENNAAIVPIFHQWIAPLKDLGVTTVSMRNSGSTDHESFNEVGIPGFQFIQDPRDYETRSLHSNQDVYERLSPSDLKQAAVVEAIFVYNTAMREQMLPRTPLPVPELFEKQREPLKDIFPGARVEEQTKKP